EYYCWLYYSRAQRVF
nr:immunoglobulin light chain junction region [Macaca mulatta]